MFARFCFVLGLLTLVSACGGEEERPSLVEGGTGAVGLNGSLNNSGGQGGSAPSSAYPKGPYAAGGPKVGEVLPNVELTGYFNEAGEELATTGSLKDFELGDLRATGANYAVIHVGGGWCGSCHVAAHDLSNRLQLLLSRGAIGLEILLDGITLGVDPTPEELEAWVDYGELKLITAMGRNEELRRVFPENTHVYIVDLATMEVLWTTTGKSVDPSITEMAVDELVGNWLVND